MHSSWLQSLTLARTGSQFAQTLEELAQELSGGKAARYYVYDADTHQLAREGDEAVPVSETTHPGSCAMYREVVQDERPVPGVEANGAAISVPVRHYGTLVGVLTVVGPKDGDVLQELAEVAGVVQEHVNRGEELEGVLGRTQELVVQAVEAATPYGQGHVGKVARLAAELATMLDLSAQSRSDVFQAAQYHDVGFLVMRNRSGFEARQSHPQVGASFLAATRSLRNLAPLVEAHHERYDGSGFPAGVSGDSVPIEAWVLSMAEDVAEFWHDSLKDGYREKVADFFEERAPAHHPDVVDALCGLVDSGRLQEILG